MDYNFKYKSPFEQKSLSGQFNRLASKLIMFLYKSWFFRKFKLDRNRFLKSHIKYRQSRNYKVPSNIPPNPKLEVYSISFLDCVEQEDSIKLRNQLIKVVSKYKRGFLSEEPSKKLKSSFHKFDSSYKTTSWGNIYYNNTKDNSELDLIDGISYSFIKGEESHFILNYTVFPSMKFNLLYKESLKLEDNEEFEIIFKSLREIVKTKKIFSSIRTIYKPQGYWPEKLFDEINFQVKSQITKDIKLGVFNSDRKLLFPRIISFEYDPQEFSTYSEEFFNVFGESHLNRFKSQDLIFTLGNSDYTKKFPNSLEIFFPYKSDEEKKNDQFNSVSYLSENYVSAIAPHWLLINISSLNKQMVIYLRKKTFLYIKKNRITIFLKAAIRLRNKLSLSWIAFERIRKDFSSETFQRRFNFFGMPKAISIPSYKGEQPMEFKESLVRFASHSSKDIKGSYEQILELFKHISEDNSTRANMRLQRLLFIIAIIGILLAFYGANSAWFNSWIEYYLNSWGIRIPIPIIEKNH